MKETTNHSKLPENQSPIHTRGKAGNFAVIATQSRRNLAIFILGAGAIIAANNINLEDVNFILYKIVVIFICNSALLLYGNYNKYPYWVKIAHWIAYYIAVHSFFYSQVYQQHIPLQDHADFHLQSCKNDTLSLIMMIAFFWLVSDPNEIEASRTSVVGFTAVAINSFITWLILEESDFQFLLSNIAYGGLLLLAGRFALQKLGTHKIKLTDEISKDSEAVQKELAMIKEDIENSYSHITKAVSSQGDELLMKLKFLKFQNLLEQNGKDSEIKFSKNRPALDTDAIKDDSQPPLIQRSSTCLNPQELMKEKLLEEASKKGNNEIPNKWNLSSKDIDLIISNIIKKSQAGLWIPDVLSKESSNIAHDTYE